VPLPFAPAAGVAAVVALAAWRARTLTRGGAVAAWAVGTAVLLGTGWAGGTVLAAFFVSGSLVSRLERRAGGGAGGGPVRPDTAAALDPKGDCRDAWQVGANGGVAAAAALVGLRDPALGFWLATASLAAAAADTWATGTGALSPRPPRHLLTGCAVPPGTSGGITLVGTLGGVAGALLVAATGALAGGGWPLLGAAAAAGIGGMFTDSALGAGVQGRFRCPRCDAASEWTRHRCGARTIHVGGVRWLTNDGVNLLATLCGAALGGLVRVLG
jgi:uncharacterized protein (TIGR00297 family)